jgi:hypothetical protein
MLMPHALGKAHAAHGTQLFQVFFNEFCDRSPAGPARGAGKVSA